MEQTELRKLDSNGFTKVEESARDLQLKSKLKFLSNWNKILTKYERIDDERESDEIDIITGKVLVDNGHLRGLRQNRGDVWVEEQEFMARSDDRSSKAKDVGAGADGGRKRLSGRVDVNYRPVGFLHDNLLLGRRPSSSSSTKRVGLKKRLSSDNGRRSRDVEGREKESLEDDDTSFWRDSLSSRGKGHGDGKIRRENLKKLDISSEEDSIIDETGDKGESESDTDEISDDKESESDTDETSDLDKTNDSNEFNETNEIHNHNEASGHLLFKLGKFEDILLLGRRSSTNSTENSPNKKIPSGFNYKISPVKRNTSNEMNRHDSEKITSESNPMKLKRGDSFETSPTKKKVGKEKLHQPINLIHMPEVLNNTSDTDSETECMISNNFSSPVKKPRSVTTEFIANLLHSNLENNFSLETSGSEIIHSDKPTDATSITSTSRRDFSNFVSDFTKTRMKSINEAEIKESHEATRDKALNEELDKAIFNKFKINSCYFDCDYCTGNSSLFKNHLIDEHLIELKSLGYPANLGQHSAVDYKLNVLQAPTKPFPTSENDASRQNSIERKQAESLPYSSNINEWWEESDLELDQVIEQ